MNETQFGNVILMGIMILVFTGSLVWVTCFHKPEPFSRNEEEEEDI